MAIKNRDVHGRKISAEDDAKNGVDYLDHIIEYGEAQVFFDQARQKGQAKFEDTRGYNYTLIYNKNGTYRVDKRGKDAGGWF